MEPTTDLDARFSGPGATPIDWGEGQRTLETAEIYWLSTVRADGRPHVTPLLAVWDGDALHFSTGPQEQKAKNLAANSQCALTTGCNTLSEGLDVVLEGKAVRVVDPGRLRRLAGLWEAKYGPAWHFDVEGDVFLNQVAGPAHVFAVAPATVFGFAKGDYGQTRWRFSPR